MTTRGAAAWAAAAVLALALTGCSGDDERTVASEPPSPTASPERAAAVQALDVAPAGTTRLEVTDLRAARGVLAFPDDFSSSSSEGDRDRFWDALAADTAAPTDGLLRPDEDTLLADHGFGAEDLDWEATFTGEDGDGWAGRFAEDVDLEAVQSAVDAGVGVLDGATLDPETRVVSVGGATDPADAWSADDGVAALVPDSPGLGVLVAAACVPAATDELTATLGDQDLDDLGPWSATFGETLATVRLGEDRPDAQDRLAYAELDDAFTDVYSDGVADPASGRVGFTIDDPRAAADLALDDGLAVAVCAD